ncbi:MULTISPECIES: endo alpha-1,4 polygalactosaminidase [unclassified Modestobacter]|uniref:endo alpha-1,4 polygalactosaminidase n=1 Tax=unclassified Modestobacter TaxID=2643866 RepID=UPI0022AA5096|nr:MULTISPECIES: endo alpha-1,4 polygalactosaminidase [unclassified Modestobacter]MCZ2823948.1 endo alpha-1,4 polygalactosaminidase [Modestobacter sp. VKM Ac-2981]MCZ2852193.1 endo alpha-1,4 polygalactosaminidase [Modestobacter sp. VKM Ac-2982]
MATSLVLLLAGCGEAGAPAAQVSTPATGARFDYQLGGAHPPADGVQVVVRDRTAEPADDGYPVCYVNAFQSQPGTRELPADLLLRDGGALVEDPDWPGEHLLDVSTADRRERLAERVGGWLTGCAADGFAAVELDNLDSWTRSGGLLDRADAAAMARLLVDRAHAAGLAVAQKNAPELAGTGLGFDFAVVEDCGAYDECSAFTDAYDVVLDVEYTDEGLAAACGVAGLSVQRRDLAVSVPGDPAYVAEWCPAS